MCCLCPRCLCLKWSQWNAVPAPASWRRCPAASQDLLAALARQLQRHMAGVAMRGPWAGKAGPRSQALQPQHRTPSPFFRIESLFASFPLCKDFLKISYCFYLFKNLIGWLTSLGRRNVNDIRMIKRVIWKGGVCSNSQVFLNAHFFHLKAPPPVFIES